MLDLSQIVWPIYRIKSDAEIITDETGSYFQDDETLARKYIVPAGTGSLSRRRLATNVSLYTLDSPWYSYVDLLHNPATRFIDSEGKIFKYKKTEFGKLTYHKILNKVRIHGGCVLIVEGVHCRFFLNRAPNPDEKYAGVLRVGRSFILYDLAERELPATRRKV